MNQFGNGYKRVTYLKRKYGRVGTFPQPKEFLFGVFPSWKELIASFVKWWSRDSSTGPRNNVLGLLSPIFKNMFHSYLS